MNNMTTTAKALPALSSLPSAFVIHLDNYSAISLNGEEQSKYLQGQVTCDVATLNELKLINGAHCNAKGKMYATFRLFDYQGSHLLFQPKATLERSLAELKKFGVFAKVEISHASELSYVVVGGEESHAVIQQYFEQLPDDKNPIVTKGDVQAIYLAGQIKQYLLVLPKTNVDTLIESLALPSIASDVFTLLAIADGFPAMSSEAIEQYVPQMLNVQAINGISFTKGCYLGQETVARMKYLGKNKRALYYLTGNATQTVSTSSIIEKAMGENWRKAGDVIASYQDDLGNLSIQAVLASDIEPSAVLRIKENTDSVLTIASLPYSLDSDE